MTQSRHRGSAQPVSDSAFPPSEPPSFLSRPTPVVPASEELRALGARSLPPDLGSLVPSPSSRPTASFPPAVSGARPVPDADEEAPTISVAPSEDEPPSFSDRPTMAGTPRTSHPSLGAAPRNSQRPTDPSGPEPHAENAFFDSAPRFAGPSVSPGLPSLQPPRRPRSRARSMVAKVLFVMMFGGVATLLGLAIKTKLDAGARPSLPAALTR